MIFQIPELQLGDLSDQHLSMLNQCLQNIATAINRNAGLAGKIEFTADLDMGGNKIVNVGTPKDSGDVITKNFGDTQYGPAAVAAQVQATGKYMLQTTRQLNNGNQQENSSTFLNNTGAIIAVGNTITVSVAAAGGSSIISLTAGVVTFQDKSTINTPARADTVTNPGAGSNYYYYSLYVPNKTIARFGPYTADLNQYRIAANTDGYAFLAMAQVNAAGGGSGGGGGGGAGGCTEIGTTLDFPPGANVRIMLADEDDWVRLRSVSGDELVVAENTLIAIWKRAQDIQPGELKKGPDGTFEPVASVKREHRASKKQVAFVTPNGTYLACRFELHNQKPIG